MNRTEASRISALAAALISALVFAGSARASEVAVEGDALRVTADVGEVNRLVVEPGPADQVAVFDDGATLRAGPGCADSGDGSVTCPRAGLVQLVVAAGDGDDAVTLGGVGLAVSAAGGEGNDQLTGTEGADRLDGGGGNDALDGGGGDDELLGGPGDDSLLAGSGTDRAFGGDGVDTLDGDLGDDLLDGEAGDDRLDGGPGSDQVAGADGSDDLVGGDGADRLQGGGGPDRVVGDEGADTLDGGTEADDLDGGPGDDGIVGGDGDDLVRTTDGADTVDAGAGDDTIEGGAGPERLAGGAGDDVISGFAGNDELDGGDGRDRLDGGEGADALGGGPGSDRVTYELSAQAVRVTLDGRPDDGSAAEADNVRADVEILTGSDLDDILAAGAAPAELLGGAGQDRLVGGAAGDRLDGGEGDDVLDGAAGPDALLGGPGEDAADYGSRRRQVVVTTGRGADDGERREGDDVAGDVERVVGGRGGDVLTALPGVTSSLVGGPGDDLLVVQDARTSPDLAVCGSGTDEVRGDAVDEVRTDCETRYDAGRLIRFGVAGSPSPRLSLRIDRTRLGADGRLRLAAVCQSETYARCRGSIRITRKGRTLGRSAFELGRGRARTIRVRLRGSQVRLLQRRGGAVTVRLSVRDGRRRLASGRAAVAVRR